MFTLHRLLLLPALFTLLVGGSSDTINNNNLLNAINANDPSTVQEVLKVTSRKQLNKKGNGGQTPLMFAAMSGKDKVVAALLEAGADFSIGDDSGYTPMHGAAFQGKSDIVMALIDFGVPFINEYHTDGRTPFHRACWGESKAHAQTVKIFLEAGADVDQATKSGQLCSQLTSNRYTQKVLRRLRKKQKGHLYRNANENDELLFSDFRGAMNNFMSGDTKSKKEKVEDDSASEL